MIGLIAVVPVFLHNGGVDDNGPLLFVVGAGVLVGIFLAWRRGRKG